MTKSELIKFLEPYADDTPIVVPGRRFVYPLFLEPVNAEPVQVEGAGTMYRRDDLGSGMLMATTVDPNNASDGSDID